MKVILVGFFFFGISTLATGQSSKPIKKEINLQSISVSFEPTKGIDKSFKFSNGIIVSLTSPEVTVFDKRNKLYISLNKISVKKREKFVVSGNSFVFRHNVDALNYFDYIFEKNDSIVFRYVKSMPLAMVENRTCLKYDFNFESYFRSRSPKENYFALTKFLNPKFFIDFTENSTAKVSPEAKMSNLLMKISKVEKDSYAKATVLLRSENTLLDSLKEQKLISEKPYQFYKNKVKNLSYLLDVETNRLGSAQIQNILAAFMDNPYGYPELYHQKLIEAVADKFTTEKAPFLDIKDGVNRDYRQVYLRLSSSSIFPEKDRNYLLTREMNRIGQALSRADFLSIFEKFEQDVKDTILVNSVRADYALDFDASRSTIKSVVLTNAIGSKLALDDLLKQHRGKIVYVDFWASWCMPCRDALPSSLKLREKLKSKGIVFVYLSIDRTLKPWQVASVQERLVDYKENYLFVNYLASDFMKQQKLTSVPRYMIFDKKGNLVYANAPGAESKNLPALLMGLAK